VIGRRRASAAAGLLGSVLVLTACVGPAPTTSAYRVRASHSASTAESALETALLAVRTSQKGNLLGNYLEVLLSNAEDAVGSAQQQFDSIQPPDAKQDDDLRSKLDQLLSQASDTVSQLRIAARRDDQAAMAKNAADIPGLAKKLDDFSKATG